MNKLRLLAIVAAPVLAYPAACWIVGAKVETAIGEQYKQVDAIPFLKIVERKYDRGLFASTDTVTFEVFGDMSRALEKAQKEAAAGGDPAAKPVPVMPLRFTVRSQIQHGPLPGLSAFAAATADSELVIDGTAQQELAKLIGDKKPLTAHTVYRFDGGGTADIDSPAFAASLPGQNPGAVNRMSWEGFKAKLAFTSNLHSYTMTGEAPRLEIHDENGATLSMNGLKFEADEKRVFDDDPMLYAGKQRFTLARMSMVEQNGKAPAGVFEKVVYEFDMPANGEFVDLIAKMSAEVVQLGEENHGPAHYDFSFKNLHARSVAKLYRAMLSVYSEAATAQQDPMRAIAPMREPALELLRHGPEIRIDRISFKTAKGEARLSANAKLNDVKQEDFTNPLMLLGKLEAGGELLVPEELLLGLSAGKPAATFTDEEDAEDDAQSRAEESAMRLQMAEAQLAGFAEQGYITRADGMVKSKIAFRNGALTVNDKPFSPAAMAGPPPPGHAVEDTQMPPGMRVR